MKLSPVTRYGPGVNHANAFIDNGHTIDVVGCGKSDLGRSCTLHPICGLSVDVGDLLTTHKVILSKFEGMFHSHSLEIIKDEPANPFAKWKLPELKARCALKNIEIPAKSKKDDIIALLDDRVPSIWSGKSASELRGECKAKGLRTERENGVGDASISVLIARLEQRIDSRPIKEEAVKVMSGTCIVGFFSKSMLHLWGVNRLTGLTLEVSDVCAKSSSDEIQRQSFQAGGKIVTEVVEVLE
jgi:hypothetical protein